MIIDLKAIDRSSRHFNLAFGPDWWQQGDEFSQIVGLHGTLESQIDIARAGVKYILDGSLSGSLNVRCDRCLDIFRRSLEYSFRLFLSADLSDPMESEYELSEDDMRIHFINGNEVDLDDIIREQVYMSLTVKCLCSENCRGLCPVCGTNLNLETCRCKQGEGHPGWAKLANLKLDSHLKD